MSEESAAEDELLSYAGMAAITGLTAGTLRHYRRLGLLPEPDELPVPDRPRWRRSTVIRWQAQRPGRGAPGRARKSQPG